MNIEKPAQPVPYRSIFLIIAGFLLFYFLIIKESLTINDSSNEAAHQLAVINDSTDTPRQVTIDKFKNLLTSLSKSYHGITKQEIVNALIVSYDFIKQIGHSPPLIQVVTAFEEYSRLIDKNAKITIEMALTAFLKSKYQNKDDSFFRSLSL